MTTTPQTLYSAGYPIWGVYRLVSRGQGLRAQVTVLETEVHRHECRSAADDLGCSHIKRTSGLMAGARDDTIGRPCSSS
ncbi:hypothetical protein Tco_0926332 [Tanacetum coccineum]|uniref:Uncharacterized protein n=1 Tax=Tanacetum coccineum TaxID=301880 RepID=A0ABQ5DBG7_9ASTR